MEQKKQLKKPSSICTDQLRSVGNDRLNPIKISSKEMLKSIVTDYVVRSFSSTPQRPKQKYQPFSVDVEVNGEQQHYDFMLSIILQKYILVSKSICQLNEGIEVLIANILEFIEKFQDKVSLFKVIIPGIVSKEGVLVEMISLFIKNKQKEQLDKDFHKAKEKMYPKYRKVLIKDPKDKHKRTYDLLCQQDEDNNSHRHSHRISRNSIQSNQSQELYKKYLPTPAASKLKELVDSCNIFNYSTKLEALRREKIIAEYCKDQLDYQESLEKVRKESKNHPAATLNPGIAMMLEDWVNEMSLSEYLFNRKYGLQKENKVAQKIIGCQSSSDDQ